MSMEALCKTLSVGTKLTSSAFCWKLGGVFEADSYNLRKPSYRVDPTVGTDKVKETPIELAAKKELTGLLTLFAEFVELPPEIKIKMN